MPLFIAAGHCYRIVSGSRDIHVSADVIAARSIEEAEGFLLRATKKKYPPTDGWTEHHAFAFPAAVEKLAHLICGDGKLDNIQAPFFINND